MQLGWTQLACKRAHSHLAAWFESSQGHGDTTRGVAPALQTREARTGEKKNKIKSQNQSG